MISRYIWSSDTKGVLYLLEPLDQTLDVFGDRVQVEARARRRRNTEARHQRLRAVVARANGDVLPVEDLRDVVRVHVLELEADDAGAAGGGRAEHADAVDLGESIHRLHDELVLVGLDRLEADLGDVVERDAEPVRL